MEVGDLSPADFIKVLNVYKYYEQLSSVITLSMDLHKSVPTTLTFYLSPLRKIYFKAQWLLKK